MVNGPRDGAWRELRRPGPGTAFARLAATHALALAGDALVTLALAGSLFFSISPTAARGRVALSLVLTMAPFAVVAPFLGPAIDRSRRGRRAMVILSCIGRAAACLYMARVLHGLLLFPAAFVVLVLSKAYSVAKSALVPSAVRGRAELVEANAKLAIIGVVAGFLVAGPGILTLKLLDARWVLRLAALVFLAAGAASLRLNPSADRLGAMSSPLRTHRAQTGTQVAAAAMALLRAEVGFLTFLVAFGFRRAGAPSWWFGVVLAASMAGTLGGSALAPRVRERLKEESMLAACLVTVALTSLALTQPDGRLWAAAMAGIVGLAAGAGKLAFDALVQRDSPEEVRGQQFARYEAGFQLVWVVGALLPVVVVTPLRQGYLVMGVASVVAAAAFVAAQRRWVTATP